MTRPATDDLARLLAEREIRRVLLTYCRGIDRCDADLVASVYHPDATDDHGSFRGPGVEFARVATTVLRERTLATTHVIGDTLFSWRADDTVLAETPVLAVHRCRDDDGEFLERFGGRYVDRMEHRDGRWAIADRVCIREWDAKERVTPAFPPGRFTEGRRDRTDPAYG